MTPSAELTRFLADHATPESRAAFASSVGTAPTAANLSAAMRAKGYQVGEAEVVAALELSKQTALTDQQLNTVAGGQGANAGQSILDRIKDVVRVVNEDLKRLVDTWTANNGGDRPS